MVIDTVSFTVTAPGAAGAAAAVVAGDSANIRNATPGKSIFLINAWSFAQAAGFTQILWPSGHDLVRNYRYRNLPLDATPRLSKYFPGQFRAQDPLTVTQAGSAVAGDVELVHAMVLYEDLPGVMGRYATLETIRRRGINVVTYEDTTTATAASVYSGPRTLGQAANTFKANTDYAILGAHIGAACGALTIRGVDSGGLRCPIPGGAGTPITLGVIPLQANWFVEQSEMLDLPLIPIFNSANAAGIFIENITNENLVAVPFSLNMVELAPTPEILRAEERSQTAAPDRGSPQVT